MISYGDKSDMYTISCTIFTFGKNAENLINKAETATEKITSIAGKGEGITNQAIDRLSKY